MQYLNFEYLLKITQLLPYQIEGQLNGQSYSQKLRLNSVAWGNHLEVGEYLNVNSRCTNKAYPVI